jgi:gamma-glutamyltranspeptidase/glutathione hydrolase
LVADSSRARRRAFHLAAAVFLAAACQGTQTSAVGTPVQFPNGWPYPAGREATFAERAMVASNSAPASEAGREILSAGGNAVDAAVAVGFALAVTYPEAGNLGGGGYMVLRMADGRTAALDFREVAPLSATADMYVDAAGQTGNRSLVGHLASGVPGSVAGLTEALSRFGTMKLADVLAPAIRLAEEGFVVDTAVERTLGSSLERIAMFAGASVWLPGGAPAKAGTVVRQPRLAATLRRIAQHGSAGFYEGETADAVVEEMRRGGGTITHEDLRRYRPFWREPIATTYRGHTILSMPPSSSGGTTIAETLNILESLGAPPAFGTAASVHLLASAWQRAFADRNSKLADPDFVKVPVAELTSKDYARTLAAGIDRDRATPTLQPSGASSEGSETTHYSVVDEAGNAVATTTTINELYGSGVFIPNAGFFMNDEMDDFTTQPGRPNTFGLIQGEQNAIAPGKRMLSAMSPSIVLDPNGHLLLVIGSRGGPRIITSVSQVILNIIDHRMSLADALSAPRVHHQALPDSIRHERGALHGAVADSLKAMGHGLSEFGNIGLVIAIMRAGGGLQGMVDPRSSGGVAGY